MIFSILIFFAFLFAIRGKKQGPFELRQPKMMGVWREAVDLFLTLALMLVFYTGMAAVEKVGVLVQDGSLLFFGLSGYALSKYQRKTDVFFLSVTAMAFFINQISAGLFHGLSLAWIVGVGAGFFQAGFWGMRHRLLFSRIPESVKGWPALCLLASFISLALWGIGRWIF